jgi:hypothetical protein
LNDPAPRVGLLRGVIAALTKADTGSAMSFSGEKMPW